MRFHTIPIACIAALSAWLSAGVAQPSGPSIRLSGKEHRLILTPAMERALQAYDSTFVCRSEGEYLPAIVRSYRFSPRQAPFALIGDFNGDGRPDAVLQGHDRSSDLLLSVLSSGKEFRVVEIKREARLSDPRKESYGMGDREERGLWAYLLPVRPGTTNSAFEEKPLHLKTDALQLVYFEKGSVLYYFHQGKFAEYVTGD